MATVAHSTAVEHPAAAVSSAPVGAVREVRPVRRNGVRLADIRNGAQASAATGVTRAAVSGHDDSVSFAGIYG